jgi:hypothetical protein
MNVHTFVGIRMVRKKMRQNEEEYEKEVRGERKIKINRRYFFLCNKNQLDALFILSLFRQSTSTCFGHICNTSSGNILYIYNNWYVLCFAVDCVLAGLRWNKCIEMHRPKKHKKIYFYFYSCTMHFDFSTLLLVQPMHNKFALKH